MGRVRLALRRKTWQEWGFDLTDAEMEDIERFFEAWFPIYHIPHVGCYRSQEALFASFEGVLELFGEDLSKTQQKNAVSASRAGYCVAVTEQKLRFRGEPDPNLRQLFRLMEQDSEIQSVDSSIGRALIRGRSLATVAKRCALDDPEIGQSLRGFPLRDAVFADIRHTLFVKLKITGFPTLLHSDMGEVMMRYGHAVAAGEEALPIREPVASTT